MLLPSMGIRILGIHTGYMMLSLAIYIRGVLLIKSGSSVRLSGVS
jgi:hypothetical protein